MNVLNGLGAFSANWIGLLQALPRYFSAARYWQDDALFLSYSGLPASSFNGAFVLNEEALTTERLQRLRDQFLDYRLPFSVQLCSTLPVPACDMLLKKAGFIPTFADPVLACDGPLAKVTLNSDVTIRKADTPAVQSACCAVFMAGFDVPLDIAEEFTEMLTRMEESQQFVAFLDGDAVGTGTLLYCNGVAAIHNVTTIPKARHFGVGKTLMQMLHSTALYDGYSGTVLASSSMGLPMYKRLGYRQDGFEFGYALPEMA